jgi:hypothetical protein
VGKALAPAVLARHMDEWWNRFWEDLIGRTSGPFDFRFFLQPAMAMLYAIRDGMKDAREGRPVYFWSLLTGQGDRRELLHEGWTAVARVIALGAAIDLVYQVIAFRRIHPLEVVVVVLFLAFVPYLLTRGPVNRVTRHFIRTRA